MRYLIPYKWPLSVFKDEYELLVRSCGDQHSYYGFKGGITHYGRFWTKRELTVPVAVSAYLTTRSCPWR